MPEFTSYPAGTPSWVDHGAKDLAASNAFYGAVFGWEADDQGEEMGHYTIYRKGGKAVAGNMAVMEGQPCVWTSYVAVDDAAATTELAKKAGATVFAEPMDVSDIGRMAIFADPTGAVVGIWQAKTFIGAELANEAGALAWNELNTRDLPAAKEFYAAAFGWTAHDADMGGGMAYTEWKSGDRTVGGMMAMPDMVPAEVPAHWLVYFGVDDTDATVAKATGAGATTVVPPTDIAPGRFAVLSDPDGAVFAVIKMNPMEA